MNSYGDAIAWCIQNEAVMRFVNRDVRPEFYRELKSGEIALELAVTIGGKVRVAHYPIDKSIEPGKSIGLAMMGCVKYFIEKGAALAAASSN